MEDLKVAHYGIVSIEIVKNSRRYQLLVPLGVSWEESQATCDEFKTSLVEMQRIAKEQADKMQAEKDASEVVAEQPAAE